MSEKKPRRRAAPGATAKARATKAATRPKKAATRPKKAATRPKKVATRPKKAATRPKKAAGAATYVYALVRATSEPDLANAPEGLPHLGPARALAAGKRFWLVVATAPLEHYSTEAIEGALKDLARVGTCGVGHSEVVQHVLDGAREPAVLPMKMFTLFASDERATGHVNAERARLERAFTRVAGAREWAVRVTFDPEVARQKAAAAMAREPGDTTGAGFLKRKKALRDERLELHKRARARVDAVHEALSGHAREARRRAHSGAWEGAPHLLEGAYLVSRPDEVRFLEAASAVKAELEATGSYAVFLIGPWPPYSFLDETTPA